MEVDSYSSNYYISWIICKEFKTESSIARRILDHLPIERGSVLCCVTDSRYYLSIGNVDFYRGSRLGRQVSQNPYSYTTTETKFQPQTLHILKNRRRTETLICIKTEIQIRTCLHQNIQNLSRKFKFL